MEVILKQDLKNLGYKDDIIKVKNGYGTNYLIPRGFAAIASESARKALGEVLKQRTFKEEKIKKGAELIADALKNVIVKVGVKTGESGKIFGSITTIQIADALKKIGHDVDRKQITLDDEHIKVLGTYTANLNLHKEVKVKINFEVIEE